MRVALAAIALGLGLAATGLAATQSRHFFLHIGLRTVGQRTFAAARTGDRITCRSDRHSVTITVPRRNVVGFKQTTVTPFQRLAIQVGRKPDGRVWALCRWR